MSHLSTRRGLCIGVITLGVLLGAVLAFAKPGVVRTKSGQVYAGEITESGQTVIVNIRGVQTRLSRDEIASINYTVGDTFREQFDARRQKLDAKDVRGRVELARFALDNRQYDLAMEMVGEAISIDPRNEEAQTLRQIIRRQEAADKTRGASTNPAPAPPAPPPAATAPDQPTTAPESGERKLLSAEDIQKIRRKELATSDNARVSIPQDVRRNFAAKANLSFAEFNALPPVQQAIRILDQGDEQMKSHVRVLSDPQALVEYKRLQPMILSGCATSNCHGGQNAGNFMLLSSETEPATYTNFYILTQYARTVGGNEGGFFQGAAERKMIDRGRGEHALLAQYGLPPAKAQYPHPKSSFNGIFRDNNDQRYRKTVDWMDKMLAQPEPAYGIDYKIPRGGNARPAPPATTQSTR